MSITTEQLLTIQESTFDELMFFINFGVPQDIESAILHEIQRRG